MALIKTFFNTVLDALFPLSSAEKELFSYSPEKILEKLPPAAPYTGLAVPLPEVRSVFAYKDPRIAKLVWNIKYKKSAKAVEMGGYALWRALIENGPTKSPSPEDARSDLVIIPMPMTARRRRERGFNQCELLVNEIKRLADMKRSDNKEQADDKERTSDKNGTANGLGYSFMIEKDLLVRTQHSSSQTLKGRSDRVEGARGIFSVNEETFQRFKKDAAILIIDDVITTGSTMGEAIDTLKAAGFEDVRGLSLAH